MTYTSGSDWSEERIELLRSYWFDEGLSAGMCAKRLGVTRNAAIGKVHRLGWTRQMPSAPPREKLPYVSVVRVKQPPRPRAPRPPRNKSKPVLKALDMPATAIRFIDRTSHDCPYCIESVEAAASPEMMVCGAPVPDGEVWCSHHASICFAGKPKLDNFNPDRNVIRQRAA